MEYIKWKTNIIIAFIDLLSVYLAVGLFIGGLVAAVYCNCMLTPTLSGCLRHSLSKIQPRINIIVAKRQVQVSH